MQFLEELSDNKLLKMGLGMFGQLATTKVPSDTRTGSDSRNK
jgi:hypothetical protein